MKKSALMIALLFAPFVVVHAAEPTSAPAPTQMPAIHAEPLEPLAEPQIVAHRDCLRETGSHVRASAESGCLPDAGTAYTNGDISATGSATLGGALRNLDPAITITSHR